LEIAKEEKTHVGGSQIVSSKEDKHQVIQSDEGKKDVDELMKK